MQLVAAVGERCMSVQQKEYLHSPIILGRLRISAYRPQNPPRAKPHFAAVSKYIGFFYVKNLKTW